MTHTKGNSFAKLALGGILGASLSLSGCEDSTSSTSADSVERNEALKKFIADCEAEGKTVQMHDGCEGKNTCAGTSYDITTGTETSHDCAGKNTCTGATCLEEGSPTSSSSAEQKESTGSSESKEHPNAAALRVFIEECEKEGFTVEEHSSCSGKNTCAGSSFDLETAATIDHDCAGKNTCAGATCKK